MSQLPEDLKTLHSDSVPPEYWDFITRIHRIGQLKHDSNYRLEFKLAQDELLRTFEEKFKDLTDRVSSPNSSVEVQPKRLSYGHTPLTHLPHVVQLPVIESLSDLNGTCDSSASLDNLSEALKIDKKVSNLPASESSVNNITSTTNLNLTDIGRSSDPKSLLTKLHLQNPITTVCLRSELGGDLVVLSGKFVFPSFICLERYVTKILILGSAALVLTAILPKKRELFEWRPLIEARDVREKVIRGMRKFNSDSPNSHSTYYTDSYLLSKLPTLSLKLLLNKETLRPYGPICESTEILPIFSILSTLILSLIILFFLGGELYRPIVRILVLEKPNFLIVMTLITRRYCAAAGESTSCLADLSDRYLVFVSTITVGLVVGVFISLQEALQTQPRSKSRMSMVGITYFLLQGVVRFWRMWERESVVSEGMALEKKDYCLHLWYDSKVLGGKSNSIIPAAANSNSGSTSPADLNYCLLNSTSATGARSSDPDVSFLTHLSQIYPPPYSVDVQLSCFTTHVPGNLFLGVPWPVKMESDKHILTADLIVCVYLATIAYSYWRGNYFSVLNVRLQLAGLGRENSDTMVILDNHNKQNLGIPSDAGLYDGEPEETENTTTVLPMLHTKTDGTKSSQQAGRVAVNANLPMLHMKTDGSQCEVKPMNSGISFRHTAWKG